MRAERGALARARAWLVPWHQLRSPLLGLLLTTAIVSYFVGERSDAVIIGLSVGLGFANEYRAERTAESRHAKILCRSRIRFGAVSRSDAVGPG